MANEIELINGVTRYELQGSGNYKYLFPLATFIVYPNADPNLGYYKHLDLRGNEILQVTFQDITDNLGATNIVEYVDMLATNEYFFGASSINVNSLANRIIVRSAADLQNIQSDKEYFLDGYIVLTGDGIDLTGKSLNIRSYNNFLGGLINLDVGGKIFTGTESGNLFFTDMNIICSNGSVFDVTAKKEISPITGVLETFYAVESQNVNYSDCASLGVLTDFRQGLQFNTGRFGGEPTLELANTLRADLITPYSWQGFRETTSIVRGIDNATILFKAGLNFKMVGSFLSDINADLGTSAVLTDFSETNFTTTSLISNVLRFKGARIFRNGVTNTDYASATPNINESSLASFWQQNEGLGNTQIGAEIKITAETVTTIAAPNTYYPLLGTYIASNLVHMSNPTAGQLKHLEAQSRDYLIGGEFVLSGDPSDVVDLKLRIYRDATASFENSRHIGRVINNSAGGLDVAYYSLAARITLNKNDYLDTIQVENKTDTSSVTGLIDSYLILTGLNN